MSGNAAITYLLRLFHTIRYLKPAQVLGRLCYLYYRPRISVTHTPALRACGPGHLCFPPHTPRMLGPQTFRFLNETRELSFPEDWNDSGADKLWLYNLHYFEDLAAEGAPARAGWHRELIRAWVAGNPPFEGNGWEPYPVSMRIGYWIKWALAGNQMDETCLRSLALQAEYLSHRVEWHLLGNHVFENARALILAGLFFEGPQAEKWLRQGLTIMDGQLTEQILADGGHFERSPMYHALVLEGLLDLIQVSEYYERLEALTHMWRGCATRMLPWLSSMSHPDGEIAFFNDAACDVALSPPLLTEYAESLGVTAQSPSRNDGVTLLEHSGYIRANRGPFAVFMDVAPVEPAYQPGHAHADTLSFELSIFAQRVLVNSGTGVYGTSEERLRQRGTAAHNTVVVDGQDSSEIWSGFRVARRARPFDIVIRGTGTAWTMTGRHDGYRRLPGHVTHRRTLSVSDTRIEVEDELSGEHTEAAAYFHFHPAVSVELHENRGLIMLPDGAKAIFYVRTGSGRIFETNYHPQFGSTLPSRCLRIMLCNARSSFILDKLTC